MVEFLAGILLIVTKIWKFSHQGVVSSNQDWWRREHININITWIIQHKNSNGKWRRRNAVR